MKKIQHSFFAYIFIVSCCFSSCNKSDGEIVGRVNGVETWQQDASNNLALANQMAQVNKTIAMKEREQILSYIQRRNWKMKELPSGIFIDEYKKGNGIAIHTAQKVFLDYSVELINGMQIYNSIKNGQKIFTVDEPGTEKGLVEAIKTMGEGSEAKIILPSHQAFGFYGDGEDIPRNAILIYHIKITKVQEPQ